MRSVDIFYGKYLSEEKRITIGGVQTYITDLCEVIRELGIEVRIVQFSNNDYVYQLSDGVRVAGFKVDESKDRKRYQELFDKAVQSRSSGKTLTIFATDTIIPPRVSEACIAIQHGIFWDIPRNGHKLLIRQIISRAVAAYQMVKRLSNVSMVVCVDYNFLNWYRTQVNRIPGYAFVVPNYTSIAPEYEKDCDTVKIIFARRLFSYRGTRVFTNAVIKLLDEGADIDITVAGTGEDEQWMHEQLDRYNNVHFITYESHESLEIHRDKHIAVVPTVGSEGTSLSLLEAMSAQCAVVCSNVGGMTNIVIDGFNGLMVDAGNAEKLYQALSLLTNDSSMRQRLAKNAYETVKQGFSKEKWQNAWKQVIEDYR